MESAQRKPLAAFISHSSQDEAIAKCLYRLVKACGVTAHLACEDLPQIGATDFPEDIANSIRESSSFVPILSHNSVRRPWVIYESGIARGAGDVRIHPVHTDSIDPSASVVSPIIERQQSYSLAESESIQKFLQIIYHHAYHDSGGPNDAVISHVRTTLSHPENSETARKLMLLAKRKSVFIAGSVPMEPHEEVPVYGKPEASQSAFSLVSRELTEALLDRKFVVASCPEVACVGAIVANTADEYAQRKKVELSSIYEIGGLYNLAISAEKKEEYANNPAWQPVHKKFRQSYLQNYQLLIVLGGKTGTRQEHDAARDIPIAITALKFLQGTGAEIYNDLEDRWIINYGPEWKKGSAETFVDNLVKLWPQLY